MRLIRLAKEKWNKLKIADMTQNYVRMEEMTFLHMELHSAKNDVVAYNIHKTNVEQLRIL